MGSGLNPDPNGVDLSVVTATTTTPSTDPDSDSLERRGRRWLIWSFIFCPCHLPISMSVLAALLGGSAFGAVVSRNTLGVGLVLGAIYLAGVGVGFRHIRAATVGRDCSAGVCAVPTPPGP